MLGQGSCSWRRRAPRWALAGRRLQQPSCHPGPAQAALQEASLPRTPSSPPVRPGNTPLPARPARSVAMGTGFFRAGNRCAFFGLFAPASTGWRGTATSRSCDLWALSSVPAPRSTILAPLPVEPVSGTAAGPSSPPMRLAGPLGAPGSERTASVSPFLPGLLPPFWAGFPASCCLAGPAPPAGEVVDSIHLPRLKHGEAEVPALI